MRPFFSHLILLVFHPARYCQLSTRGRRKKSIKHDKSYFLRILAKPLFYYIDFLNCFLKQLNDYVIGVSNVLIYLTFL